MHFRLITLDLDDTVWPSTDVLLRAEEALYAWMRRVVPRLAEGYDAASLRRHRRLLMRERPEIAHDITLVRLESLRRLLADHAYDPSLAEEAMTLFLHHRNQVEPYPEAAEVLRGLAGRARLVSVTNGNSDPARTPLRGLFHHCVTPVSAGAAKPDPAIFRYALDRAGVPAGEALHAGDDPQLDVAAAQAAGLTAVWVNRDGRDWPPDLAPPAAEVRDLRGLAAWIEGDGRAL